MEIQELTNDEIKIILAEGARDDKNRTLIQLVEYIQFISKDPDRGEMGAISMIQSFVQQGAMKPSMAIQLIQVAQNPDAQIEHDFNFTQS